MGKKTKNPGITTSNNASSNVFQALFGNLAETNPRSDSIFSDSNPFKRKPNVGNHQLELEKEDKELKVLVESPDLGDRKRKQDKKDEKDLGSGSEDEIVKTRKPKKGKLKKLEVNGVESPEGEKGSSENANLEKLDKKSKKGKLKKSDLSSELKKLEVKNDDAVELVEGEKGSSENADLSAHLEKLVVSKDDNEVKSIEGLGKKSKKKRKRDEVEEVYEAQKYGVGEGELVEKKVGEKRKKADEALDMMKEPKEGFDDEEKLLRTVFVGNLPLKIKKKALFAEFRKFGDVESVRIRSVPLLDTKKPRKGAIMQKKINDAVDSVNAYVVFETEEAAKAALGHNMAVIAGNHIRVDRACPPRKKLKGENAPLYDNKRTVFVGNLPFDVKDEEIYQLFSGIKDLDATNIEGIRVVRDPGSSLGKGIAYVLFKTRENANMVSRKHGLKLRDRELRISHAKSNATPSKRKDSPLGDKNTPQTKKLYLNPQNPNSSNSNKYNFNSSSSSYQGLRASKSGVEKKAKSQKSSGPVKFKSKAESGKKVKERSGKRPAVAARRAKEMKGGGGGSGGPKQGGGGGSGSKQSGGFKRKMDGRTPQSARGRPDKKAKH